MNVTACLVTRGDVDMQPILESLPTEWERLIWDNGAKGYPTGHHYKNGDDWRPDGFWGKVTDLSVYGRYAAIEYASHDLIYVQDDDVIVSDPQAIVDEWMEEWSYRNEALPPGRSANDHLVANMPSEFRPNYPDSCLVGFGAVFHRDAPGRVFSRFFGTDERGGRYARDLLLFYRECDTVLTTLMPRVLIDVPKENLPYATDANRLYRQPEHVGARMKMLELARRVRDDNVG